MRTISVYLLLSIACFAILSCAPSVLTAQTVVHRGAVQLEWNDQVTEKSKSASELIGAVPSSLDPDIPVHIERIPLDIGIQVQDIRIENPRFGALAIDSKAAKMDFSESLEYEWQHVAHRGEGYLQLTVLPYRGGDGQPERLEGFEWSVIASSTTPSKRRKSSSSTTQSRLSSGEWYRIPITKDGVYRLSRSYLDNMGVDVGSLDPADINIYGNDEGQLPYANDEFRYDDLRLKASIVTGSSDNSFDNGDEVIFYAKGPHEWNYDSELDEYIHQKHAFSTRSYVFLGIGVDPAQRVEDSDIPTGAPSMAIESFDHHTFYEEDLNNIIKSGRRAVGEQFGLSNELLYSGGQFNLENIDPTGIAKVTVRATAKVFGTSNSARIDIECQGNTNFMNISGFGSNSYLGGRSASRLIEFQPSSGNFAVQCDFQAATADAEGWIDYVRINARRLLRRTTSQLDFRAKESEGQSVVEYVVGNMDASRRIWDVTDAGRPLEVPFNMVDGNARFLSTGDTLRQFIVWDSSNLLSPSAGTSVANQNLHGIAQQDMVIITAVPFLSVAEDLADFHRAEGLDVFVSTPQAVYNEFSSGTPDITAIKSLMRMLYDRAQGDEDALPDYLLLIGDGSYENIDIDPASSIYIPSYHSVESNSLVTSYVSDDYFGYLDFTESEGTDGAVDLGIGRLPVKSLAEAQAVYQKILRYSSRQTGVIAGQCNDDLETPFGPWRNRVLLIGDDEDTNRHMSQANSLGDRIQSIDVDFELQKVFIDAYLQESTPGGARYPEAAEDVKRAIESGALLVSYTGHGGEVGWAQERILDVPTIQSFSNSYSLPTLLTATCEFARYDDPDRTSAGELILLNPDGGVISLFTTTRLVYSQPNFDLSMNFADIIMRKDATEYSCSVADFNFPNGLRMGDIMRVSKNCTTSSPVNKLNFSLLGDPALAISYPEHSIVVDSIMDRNGVRVDGLGGTNNLQALGKYTVYGRVYADAVENTLDDFDGVLDTRVFDKEQEIVTLANDDGNPYSFNLRNAVMYNGRASITDGRFSFEFVVPKDIRYDDGMGKMHFYALGNDSDGQGSKNDFTVNGTDSLASEDAIGPTMSVVMDGPDFVEGGLTNESPWLIADLNDENGINTVGTGIGHDITLIIDGNTADRIVLNDFYTADLDSYQKGTVRYQLLDLEEGPHSIELKAWDIYNNSSTVKTDFVVEKKEDLSLQRVVNYPNPFTTRTEFLFEHNQACDALDVRVQVYTTSGKLVRTIHRTVDGHQDGLQGIDWDGRDEYGDRLGRGVYVYELSVRTPDGQREEVIEKLVIL